jgi:Protein of unknown function (DUF2934)
MSHHTAHISPQFRHSSGSLSSSTAQRLDMKSASDADIAKRAYAKYEARGRADGYALEDWTAASRELVAETFGHLGTPSVSPSRHAS